MVKPEETDIAIEVEEGHPASPADPPRPAQAVPSPLPVPARVPTPVPPAGTTPGRAASPSATLGNYRLIAGLGRGGMGDVFLAVRQGLAGFNKLVVIKQLRPSLVADAEFLHMFLDEARLAARLSHPNIVQTNEVGQDSANHYFIAMEYLDGQPYHRLLRKAHALKSGLLTQELQIHVLLQVLDGLHYAHEVKDYDGTPLQIVHRDVSPQNVFITYSGEVKILDFGIAKAIGATVETRSGVYKGKLPYMSPEQMHGEHVDRRADLFSVGAMLWATAAGHSLWHNVSNMDIARGLISGQIPSLEAARPDASPDLIRICNRALAPRVEDRYQSALEFRRDLQAYLDSTGEEIGREQVAAAMEAVFAEDHAQMQKSIEAQIRDAKALTSGNFTVVPLPVVEGASSSVRDAERSGLLTPGGGTLAPGASPGTSQSQIIIQQTGVGWKVAAIVVPLALLLGGGVAYVLLERARPAPVAAPTPAPQPAPVAAPVVAQPAPTPAPPARPQLAQLTVKTTPVDATILLDGAAVANPLQVQLPVDGQPHTLRVEAQGFRPELRQVTLDQPMLLDIGLQREEQAVAKKRPTPAPARPTPTPAPAPTPTPAPPKPEDKPKPKIDIIADPNVQIVD